MWSGAVGCGDELTWETWHLGPTRDSARWKIMVNRKGRSVYPKPVQEVAPGRLRRMVGDFFLLRRNSGSNGELEETAHMFEGGRFLIASHWGCR